jgi:hypothetical protein
MKHRFRARTVVLSRCATIKYGRGLDTVADDNVFPMKPRRKGTFGPGNPPPGRKGSINKHTRILKDAIMLAAELEGQDGNGKGKLTGFMRKVAQEDLRAFCMLLGRVIPLQVEQKTIDDRPKSTTYKSMDEVKRELASRGIDMDVMFKIVQADPTPMAEQDEPESLDVEEDDA